MDDGLKTGETDQLRQANDELWRENERLARAIAEQQADLAGRSGSGAAAFLRRLRTAEAESAAAQERMTEAELERDRLKAVLESVERSPSWRLTKPLRALKRMVARS